MGRPMPKLAGVVVFHHEFMVALNYNFSPLFYFPAEKLIAALLDDTLFSLALCETIFVFIELVWAFSRIVIDKQPKLSMGRRAPNFVSLP